VSEKCERCERHVFSGQFCRSCNRYVTTVNVEKGTKTVQLWRMLDYGDVIQPDDHYASSLTGHVCRCTPDMMGKSLPYLHMPHLRPAGTRVETLTVAA
jgi:hypothetical protein